MNTIFDELARRVRKEMRVDQSVRVTEASTLEDLGLASLQVADIIFSIEEDFGIQFDEQRAAEIKTFGQLVALVEESLGDRAPSVLQKVVNG